MAVIDETGEYLCDDCRLRVYRKICYDKPFISYGNFAVIVAQEWWASCDPYDGPVEFCNHCDIERY